MVLQAYADSLPKEVVQPGAPVGCITVAAAADMGLPDDCMICGGTTGSEVHQVHVTHLVCASRFGFLVRFFSFEKIPCVESYAYHSLWWKCLTRSA